MIQISNTSYQWATRWRQSQMNLKKQIKAYTLLKNQSIITNYCEEWLCEPNQNFWKINQIYYWTFRVSLIDIILYILFLTVFFLVFIYEGIFILGQSINLWPGSLQFLQKVFDALLGGSMLTRTTSNCLARLDVKVLFFKQNFLCNSNIFILWTERWIVDLNKDRDEHT